MRKTALFILSVVLIFSMTTFAQPDLQQITETEQTLEMFGLTTAAVQGKQVVATGAFGRRTEEFSPLVKKMADRFGEQLFGQFDNEKNRKELSDYLKGFLSNSSIFAVAEVDQRRLGLLSEEFAAVEMGTAKFADMKERGQYLALNYLIKPDIAFGKNGENMLAADLIDMKTGERYTAIVGKRGYQISNLQMAMRLSTNLEEIIQAGSPEERKMLYEIQRAEAACDNVNLDTKILMVTAASCYAGGALIGIAKGGFSGWFFGAIFSGGLSGVGWWAYMKYKDLYDLERANLKRLTDEYNTKFNKKRPLYY
ncbi:MAG: hypothetical protein ABIA75_04755 [Candidatus Neomarinimicrobiota bacterium]